jgi:hypothetical protein
LELESAGAGSESLLAIVFHHDRFEFGGDATGEYFFMGILYNSFLESADFGSAFRTEVLVRGIARYNRNFLHYYYIISNRIKKYIINMIIIFSFEKNNKN